MILIDSVFIHNGGGRILLDYIVTHLNFDQHKYVLLLDARVEGLVLPMSVETHYAKNLTERNKFYSQNQSRFRKVFCLGNIPPRKKINGIFINYLHSSYYVSALDKTYLKHYLITTLKKLYFNRMTRNVDSWIVQTDTMKKNLMESQKIEASKIKIIPFYNKLENNIKVSKKENQFLYVSNGNPNKNHVRLINAFCKFYDVSKKGILALTVSDYCTDIIELISEKVKLNYPIINYGYVNREKLSEIYNLSPFVIYPSLTESFGLGLIEPFEFNCKILAANLDYVHDICNPSLMFDPYSEKEIYNTFMKAFSEELPNSVLLIENEIKELVNLIESN